MDFACVGFGEIRAGGFLPVEAAGGYKTVACAYFRGRGACSQYGPKVMVGARTLDPNGDAYYPRGQNINPEMSVCAKTLDPNGDLYYFT